MFGNLGWRADVEVDTRVELVHPVEAVLPRHAPVCLQTQHGSSDDETRNEALFVFDSGTLQIRKETQIQRLTEGDSETETLREKQIQRLRERNSETETHREKLRDRDTERNSDAETHREKLRDRLQSRDSQRERH